eukprot:5195523-Pleurochrysis_carterae.AAC.1
MHPPPLHLQNNQPVAGDGPNGGRQQVSLRRVEGAPRLGAKGGPDPPQLVQGEGALRRRLHFRAPAREHDLATARHEQARRREPRDQGQIMNDCRALRVGPR